MKPNHKAVLAYTDPELVEFFDRFAFEEIPSDSRAALEPFEHYASLLAVLLGCQGVEEFKVILPFALDLGLSPVQVKEIVYQAIAYLGMGRVAPFLKAVNEILEARGVILPLEGQAVTNPETRLEVGARTQADIFGDHMLDFYKSGAKESQQINYWLADNCFGDYYTRKGLDYKQRELITFCFLYAQGGCEPQLISHIKANIRVGNSKELLIAVISSNIPFIGYPRTLNALNAINTACSE